MPSVLFLVTRYVDDDNPYKNEIIDKSVTFKCHTEYHTQLVAFSSSFSPLHTERKINSRSACRKIRSIIWKMRNAMYWLGAVGLIKGKYQPSISTSARQSLPKVQHTTRGVEQTEGCLGR